VTSASKLIAELPELRFSLPTVRVNRLYEEFKVLKEALSEGSISQGVFELVYPSEDDQRRLVKSMTENVSDAIASGLISKASLVSKFTRLDAENVPRGTSANDVPTGSEAAW
jgi:hypothetical protein